MNRRLLGIAVLAVFGVALWVFTRPAAPTPPVPAQEPLAVINPRIPGQDQAAPMVLPEPPKQPLVAAAAEAPPRKNELPKPPPTQYPNGLKPLTPPAVPKGPVDKRGGAPNPNQKREMEIIGYAFETLEEDVEECLKQWDGAQPGQAQEVMIAFEIDKDGLQKSWLEHEGEVPFGPRTCLANAVYGLDWSKIVDQPAMLSQRYTLTRDGGR